MSYENKIPAQYLSARHLFKNLRFCKNQKPYNETVHTLQITGLFIFVALTAFIFTLPYLKAGDNTLFFVLVSAIFLVPTTLFFCGFIFYDLKKIISLYLVESGRVDDFFAMHEKSILTSAVKTMNHSAPRKQRL